VLTDLRQSAANLRRNETGELAEPPVKELAAESEKTRKHGDTFKELQPMPCAQFYILTLERQSWVSRRLTTSLEIAATIDAYFGEERRRRGTGAALPGCRMV
jgi:hypothetical protein